MALRKRSTGTPGEQRITPRTARNVLGVAKVVAPVVLPVVVPYLATTASVVRDRIDRARARRLGVPVEELARYSGKGGALHARISGTAMALAELRTRQTPADDQPQDQPQDQPRDRRGAERGGGHRGADGGDAAFADRADTTLRQLAAAVRAAERMPSARRRAAHRAVAAELDQLEEQLLRRLGVRQS